MTKAEARSLALSLGLAVAQKHDSQDICFVPDGDYTQIVVDRAVEPLPHRARGAAVRAVAAFAVLHAADRRERALAQPHDLLGGVVLRLSRKAVAAALAAQRLKIPGAAEYDQNAFQIFFGYFLPRGDLRQMSAKKRCCMAILHSLCRTRGGNASGAAGCFFCFLLYHSRPKK